MLPVLRVKREKADAGDAAESPEMHMPRVTVKKEPADDDGAADGCKHEECEHWHEWSEPRSPRVKSEQQGDSEPPDDHQDPQTVM